MERGLFKPDDSLNLIVKFDDLHNVPRYLGNDLPSVKLILKTASAKTCQLLND